MRTISMLIAFLLVWLAGRFELFDPENRLFALAFAYVLTYDVLKPVVAKLDRLVFIVR